MPIAKSVLMSAIDNIEKPIVSALVNRRNNITKITEMLVLNIKHNIMKRTVNESEITDAIDIKQMTHIETLKFFELDYIKYSNHEVQLNLILQ